MGAVLHTNLLIFLLQSVVLSPSWSSVNWDATYERAVDLEINSHLPLWSKTKVFEYSFIDIYTTVLVLVSFSNRDEPCSSWQIVQQWNLIKNYGFCLVWWSGGPGSSSSKITIRSESHEGASHTQQNEKWNSSSDLFSCTFSILLSAMYRRKLFVFPVWRRPISFVAVALLLLIF